MTRVLYVDHPEADFLSAVVFMGLCEELGDDNVVDYPFKASYHGLLHEYPSPYAFPVNGPGDMPWERPAKEAPDKTGTTGPYEWMRASAGRQWSREEVLSRMSEFDLVVLAAPRTYNVPALEGIISRIGRDKMPPIVMLDGEDYWQIRDDVVERIRPRVYFKRELMPGQGTHCRLEPFPFASPIRFPVTEVAKDIDVLFLGGGTWPARQEACDALRIAFGDRFVGGVHGHMPHRDYLNMIARARVAISVRGFGYDTLKFWEILSMPGTLLVGDRLPIIKPAPFEHGRDVLYFDGPKELVEAVRCALEDEPWRARLAASGNAHLQAHHTARARAKQLLQISLEG